MSCVCSHYCTINAFATEARNMRGHEVDVGRERMVGEDSRSASDKYTGIIEKTRSQNAGTFQRSINGTLSSGEFKLSYQRTRSFRHLLCQQFFGHMSLMSRSNVSSCSFLPLRVGKPLFTDASIESRSRGVRFFGARFVRPP